MTDEILVVEVSGTHFEIGTQLGEQCFHIANKLRRIFRQSWDRKNIHIDKAVAHGRKFLPFAEAFYPEYMDELRGYAYATDMDVEEIFAWFCCCPAPKGCTDLAFSQRATFNEHVYLVHNEDYDLDEADCPVLVRMKPPEAPAFLAMSYGGVWFNAGVNEEGIALAGNGLDHSDEQVGIPGDFSFRKTLSARTLSEAMHFSTPEGRSFSYCNIIADHYGEIYAMEGSATDFAWIHKRDWMVHSNHYLDPRMAKDFEAVFKDDKGKSPGVYASTIYRQHRAENLVMDALPLIEECDMMSIMSDHANKPWSICRHEDKTIPYKERSKTLFSEIIDVTERTILLCQGHPCENDYVLHKL